MKSLMLLLALTPLSMQSLASEQGFVPLFNGKDFTGWKISNPDSFKIENGAIGRLRLRPGGVTPPG